MIKIEDIRIDNVNEVDDKLYINFCSFKPQTLANYDEISSKITETSDDDGEIDWIEVTLIMDAEDCRRTEFTTYAVNDYDRARLDIKTGLNCYESILSNDEQNLLLDYAMENITSKYVKVGFYIPTNDGKGDVIVRDFYKEGFIFKDEEAFLKYPDKVCYVPELTATTYTKNDILEMCTGNEELTKDVFDHLTWQHPESLLDDWFVNSEIDTCGKCHKIFYSYEATKCPFCGTTYKREED